MPTEFNLPDLGENIESGDVVSILVAVGDRVEEDQPIIELETDKAVIEVPCSIRGIVQEVHIKEGDTAAVGQRLLTVATTTEEETPAVAAAPIEPSVEKKAEPAPADPIPQPSPVVAVSGPVEFYLPDLGENIESGDVVSILVAVGDSVEEDQPVIELETDKAVIEVPCSTRGTVKEIHVQEGSSAAVGQLLLTLEATDITTATERKNAPAAITTPSAPSPVAPAITPDTTPDIPASTQPAQPSTTEPSKKLVAAAPSVRRLAREIGVDIAQVTGSGPGGRLSAKDVKAHSKAQHETRGLAPTATAAAPLPDFSQWGEIEHQPMSKVRQITAERLTQAWTTIPMVTQFDKADISDLEKWRKQYAKKAEDAGGKLTPTAILIKVLGAALKTFPQFNASIDIANNEIIYKKYCNIGIAVDTPHGLMVPVVRDVDQKNIIELAVELGEMAKKTRERKIGPADMQGGSMTISNVGSMGGTGFTPIVNPPEVAILGVARSSIEPTYIDGELQPRTQMPLSLSYDHRVIDGADGARFLRWVCEALQNPFVVLLEG